MLNRIVTFFVTLSVAAYFVLGCETSAVHAFTVAFERAMQ